MLDNNGPESLKELENIERASLQGAHCIRRILEFTKSAQDVEVARLDLAATLEEVVSFTRGRWHDEPALRGVKNELKYGFPNDLPNTLINEAETREVIAERIYNTVDAMPEGGTLTISADVEEEMLVVRFTDTGVGMDETTKNRVFEPYFTTKGVDGTGLGLANVRSIVERNAGRIDLKSVPGHGTTVSIYLPLEGISLQEFLPFDSDDSSRILVIAGKAEVRELLERVLRMDGHEVIAPPDAEAAAALLEDSMEKLDLILMDRRMGGEGFTRIIQRTASDPRAIFFSSWGHPPNGGHLPESSDADLSLMQPFSVARVIETVRETLQLRKA
jgi:CheY-like chemotaxis protein